MERKNLFDKWHDVFIKANLSKEKKDSFSLWVNGNKKLIFNGITRQLASKQDPLHFGIYNTGSKYGDKNINDKNLGNIIILFDEIRVGDTFKNLKL